MAASLKTSPPFLIPNFLSLTPIFLDFKINSQLMIKSKITITSVARSLESLAKMVKAGFDGVDRRFENVEERLEKIELKLDHVAYKFEVKELQRRMDRVEKKIGLK